MEDVLHTDVQVIFTRHEAAMSFEQRIAEDDYCYR